MASKIIKLGSEPASGIHQFFFMNNSADVLPPAQGQNIWPDLSDSKQPVASEVPTQVEIPVIPEIDMERLEKEAYEKGFQVGQIAGMETAENRVEPVMKRYSDSILEIGNIKQALYAQAEHEVVSLAIEVAKKIVHREVQVDRDIIQTLVRVALSHVTENSSITVRMNPMDYQFVMERGDTNALSEGKDITLQSDNTIGQGGCLVETKCGDIDARIEEKFREVENAFFKDMK